MIERIRDLTHYDPVTGIPNRGVLRERLDRARAVVSSIIAMGNATCVNLIAEGFETERQSRFVKEAGCRCAQGFGLAATTSMEFLSAHRELKPGMPVRGFKARIRLPPGPVPVFGEKTDKRGRVIGAESADTPLNVAP
ncbi:MAG: EAL domain-containing protein [Spirochaetales bacterium]